MSLYGAFDKTKHFEELNEPLHTQEGTLSPATRRARALANIYGNDPLSFPENTTFEQDLTVTGVLTANGGMTLKQGAVVVPDGASYAVLVANSGKTHVVVDQTATVTMTLPAAAAGLNYEFWYGGAAADAQDWVIVPTAGFYIGGVNHQDTDGETTAAVYSDGNSNDVFTVIKPEAGTVVRVVSDGTNWYVNGTVCSVTVPTMADA